MSEHKTLDEIRDEGAQGIFNHYDNAAKIFYINGFNDCRTASESRQAKKDAEVQELVDAVNGAVEYLNSGLLPCPDHIEGGDVCVCRTDPEYAMRESLKDALKKFQARKNEKKEQLKSVGKNFMKLMSKPAYCNFCRRVTTTKDWDCTICGLSKPTPKEMK